MGFILSMNKILNSKRSNSQKAFTLIELLIVIAVLGILAAAIITAINPVKRINQAKDSNYKSDIAQIATAMQTYLTARGTEGKAYYPSIIKDLVTANEMKSEPKPSGKIECANSTEGGTTYCLRIDPPTCTTGSGNCVNVAIYAPLNDRPGSGTDSTDVWCWMSSTGQASKLEVTSCIAPAP